MSCYFAKATNAAELPRALRPMGHARASGAVPTLLASRVRPDASKAVRRRSLVLNMGMGGMMGSGSGGGGLTINGKPFDMNRIDETVTLGSTEIWEVSG